ncbi:MAG TPA: ATP-binding protein [Bryobacteraceae bacterium]|nr:ATP-binding protein [Bryobacteraceae bacterium]
MSQAARVGPGSAATTALRIAVVCAGVAASTFVLRYVVPANAATAGFAYLVIALFAATRWGLAEAIAGSLVAVLCFNFFFLPPLGTFTIADPENWVAMVALLVTSITAGRLSTRVRRQAIEAGEREREIERLYSLSRAILLIDPAAPVGPQMVSQMSQTLEATSVALYDRSSDEIYRAGAQEFPAEDARLRTAASDGATLAMDGDLLISPVRLGGRTAGSLGISGVVLSESGAQSVTNLAAIGLERTRAQQAAARAEASRQSDELKSTLLDAIAHEFKTPLTTIKASTTALLADRPPTADLQRGYIELVDEEADRLGGLVTEAIQMARFEAGQVRLQREQTAVAELLEAAIAKTSHRLRGRQIDIDVPSSLPGVMADREMMELALRQLLDNAAKYSPPDSPIAISAASVDGHVAIRIRDFGKGVPPAESARIFDKFYRGRQDRGQIPGAGLGLAIARAVVESHHGTIRVESAAGEGAVFSVELQPAKEGE